MTNQAPEMAGEVSERYAALDLGDGDFVIYDREESSAWLQSDYTCELAV